MDRVRNVWLVARRDFTQRIRSRIFIISLALVAFLILGIGPFLLSQIETEAVLIGVVNLGPTRRLPLKASQRVLGWRSS